jgi:acyl-coenzyme A thioesterase PaaI-like protein
MSFVKTPEAGANSAAEHLEMELVQFAAGVAVYEMPARFVENSVLVAFAETAMNAAATTAVPDLGSAAMTTRDLCAHFHSRVPADARTLRAEAIVVRSDGHTVRVEADVLADGLRVAGFEANSGVTR